MSARPPLSLGRPLSQGFAALAALILGFGVWAAAARIVGAVVAPGRIEVELNRQAMQHAEGGRVAEVAVREGDAVEAGALLIRLDDGPLASEIAIVDAQLHELAARRARLEAERDGRREPEFDAALLAVADRDPQVAELVDGQRRLRAARAESAAREAEQLSRRRVQIIAQIDGLSAQAAALAAQLALTEEELDQQQTLRARGLAETGRVLALEREKARLEGGLGELAAAKAAAAERVTEVEIEGLRLESRQREEALAQLRDQTLTERELAERRRALAARRAQLDLRAPVAGVVHGLRLFGPGAVMNPAEPALYLIPRGRPLVIAAEVPAIDIDAVYPGQPVILRFPAFHAAALPEIAGEVARVSGDAFRDERTGRSFYRAEIVLPEGERAKLGDLALVPGMPVEAYLTTAERSPAAFLLQPLTDYFLRAFRER